MNSMKKQETKKEQIGRVVYGALAVIQGSVGHPKGYGGRSHIPGLLDLSKPLNSLNSQVGKRNRAKFDAAHKNLESALGAQEQYTALLRQIKVKVSDSCGPTPTYNSTDTIASIKEAVNSSQKKDVPKLFAKAVAEAFGKRESIGSGEFSFPIDPMVVTAASNLKNAYDAFEEAPKGDITTRFNLGGAKEASVYVILEALKEIDAKITGAVGKAGGAIYKIAIKILEPLEKKYPHTPQEIRIPPILGC